MRRWGDRGETLVETIMTIVVIGGAIAALLLALSNAAVSATSDRRLVTADVVMRSYAEATKSAVRIACPTGRTFDVRSLYKPPNGFSVSSTWPPPLTGRASNACPDRGTAPTLRLRVDVPAGKPETMDIGVRTP